MAPWQVNFQVVPHRAIAAAQRTLTAAIVRDTEWWIVGGAALPDLRERLATIARPAAQSPGAERWGDAEGNAVEVQRVGGRVARISAHVDVRRLDPKFGAALLGFVRSAQSVLMREDGWVAEPTVGAFSGALRSDPAWAFANEPAPLRIARDEQLEDGGE